MPASSAPSDRTVVLATVPADEPPPPVSPPPAVSGLHVPPPPGRGEYLFGERGGVAFLVGKGDEVEVVHNGRAGKPCAAVNSIALSPDGKRIAYGALEGGKWRVVVDGREGAPFSAVRQVAFSPDGSHVAYQAMDGDLWKLVVDTTIKTETRTRFLNHEFGRDSSRLVFITDVGDDDRGRLIVSDLSFKTQVVVDPRAASLVLSADRTRAAAVSATGGRQRLLSFALDRPNDVQRGPPQDSAGSAVFGPDGTSLAYLATRSGRSYVVLGAQDAPLPAVGEMVGQLAVRPDGKAVGALIFSQAGADFRPFFAEAGPPEAVYLEADGLVYSGDGRAHAYAARREDGWVVVVDGHEGPVFDRVVTPVFSPDGTRLAYRARKDGKRFVVVADLAGATLKQHSAFEQVFPVLFTPDGKSIAYGVKDGRQLAWRVEAP